MTGTFRFFMASALLFFSLTAVGSISEPLRQVRVAETLVTALQTTDPDAADLQNLDDLTLPELLPVQDAIARIHGTWRIFKLRSEALPLLPKGAAQRDYLVKMILFLSQVGTAPSGLGTEVNFWSMGRSAESLPFFLLNGHQTRPLFSGSFEGWVKKHPQVISDPVKRLEDVKANLKTLNSDALQTAMNYLKNAEVLLSK